MPNFRYTVNGKYFDFSREFEAEDWDEARRIALELLIENTPKVNEGHQTFESLELLK